MPVGLLPTSVAIGDFNADGHLDLAVANGNSDDVSILRGRGDGTFIPLGAAIVGGSPVAVVVGDFNRDGRVDIAAARSSSGGVAVLFGNGNGTFQAAVTISSGIFSPTGLALADLNGDLADDLIVVGGSFSPNVAVLLGNGDGTFQTPRMLTAGRNPSSVAAGDVNGDGIPDLVVANSFSSNVTVFLGNGNGTFQPGVDFFILAAGPASVALADINGDGRVDIVTANSSSNNVSVLLNVEVPAAAVLSPVSFVDIGEFPVDASPRFLAVGDFNGDGQPDLATCNAPSNNLAVLINATQ
jgi:hypothetical protein